MNTNKGFDTYVSPEIEMMDIISEGVLCTSNNGEQEDGGMLPE